MNKVIPIVESQRPRDTIGKPKDRQKRNNQGNDDKSRQFEDGYKKHSKLCSEHEPINNLTSIDFLLHEQNNLYLDLLSHAIKVNKNIDSATEEYKKSEGINNEKISTKKLSITI